MYIYIYMVPPKKKLPFYYFYGYLRCVSSELLRLKQKNVQTCLRLANLLLQLVNAETCQESCCKVDLHVELSVPYLLKRRKFSQGIMFRVQATGYKIAKGRFFGGLAYICICI